MTHCPSSESMQLTLVAAVVMAHVITGCSPSKVQLSGVDTDLTCLITPPVLAKVFAQPGHLYRTAVTDEGPVERAIVPAATAEDDSDEPEVAVTANKFAAEEATETAAADAGQGWLGGG